MPPFFPSLFFQDKLTRDKICVITGYRYRTSSPVLTAHSFFPTPSQQLKRHALDRVRVRFDRIVLTTAL
ncbi:hypothetical protein JTE90_013946 [Oedothorax gibbosus]|uniref:Uncharacterized protein n=1 Tax=Oedothorax gibbosus TaxID=931172 RepID=A0AAV6UCV1_9ARAC|nr:hypothetical protein JTE90_013946 [Oedothorax gibbosus]